MISSSFDYLTSDLKSQNINKNEFNFSFFDDNSSLDFNSFFDITRHSTDYQLTKKEFEKLDSDDIIIQLSSSIKTISSCSNQLKELSEILIMLKKLSEDNNLSLLYKAKMIIIEKEFINRMKDWVMFELKNNSHDKKDEISPSSN